MNKERLEPNCIMSLTHLTGLEILEIENKTVTVGAKVTWTELGEFCQEHLPELARNHLNFCLTTNQERGNTGRQYCKCVTNCGLPAISTCNRRGNGIDCITWYTLGKY